MTFNLQILQMVIYDKVYIGSQEQYKLIKVLEKEGKSAIDCFKMNDMTVNPDKFQAMIKKLR